MTRTDRAKTDLVKARNLIALAQEHASDLPTELKIILNGSIMVRIKACEEALTRSEEADARAMAE